MSASPFEPPAVLDVEASGFGAGSYPIEIGFVLPDGSSYCTLIRPAAGWTHWDAKAQALHHISPDTIARHGRDVAEVARQLNLRLRGQTLYCDGWAHDYAWIGVLFDAANTTPAFKLDSLRSLLSDHEAEAWATLKDQVASEMRLARHRASGDAKVLQRTLITIMRRRLSHLGP